MKGKRRFVVSAAVAAVVGATSLLPAQADETDDVDHQVGVAADLAQYLADGAIDLAKSPPPVPVWLPGDPVAYAGQAVEAGQAYAKYWADLAGVIAPVPWLPGDPVAYGGQAVEAGQAYAKYWADLAGVIAPMPWLPSDPVDYAGQAVEVAKTFPAWYVGHAAAQRYGAGPFTGAIAYDDPPAVRNRCAVDADRRRAVVSITAQVAFTNGSTSYTGPLRISGTGCNARPWGSMTPKWKASGTDPSGNTLVCHKLGGLVLSGDAWSATVFGSCKMNGVSLPKVQMLLKGGYVSGGKASAAVAGVLWMNTY